jgi:hypothetical protein
MQHGLTVIVNYTPPDGGIGSIYPDMCDTIAETNPHIAAAVLEAGKLGSAVTVRFIAAEGWAVSQWRVA